MPSNNDILNTTINIENVRILETPRPFRKPLAFKIFCSLAWPLYWWFWFGMCLGEMIYLFLTKNKDEYKLASWFF